MRDTHRQTDRQRQRDRQTDRETYAVASLNLTRGSLLLSVPLNLLFAELKTSGNAPTLLSIGLHSNLFATAITTLF